MVRSACEHLEIRLLFQDTDEVHPVPMNVHLTSLQFPFPFRGFSEEPAVCSPPSTPAPGVTTRVFARIPCCYTHISRVLPLQRPQHKLLHHHVKAKFLKPSTGGCRSPRPAAQSQPAHRLTGLAPQGKPSCEETSPGNQGSTAGGKARGTLPPAPRRFLPAAPTGPWPAAPPRSRARGAAAGPLRPNGGAQAAGRGSA